MSDRWARRFAGVCSALLSCCTAPPPVDSGVDRADATRDDAIVADREQDAGTLDAQLDASSLDAQLDAGTLDAQAMDVAREDSVAVTDSGSMADRAVDAQTIDVLAPSDSGVPRASAGCGRPATSGVTNGAITVGGARRTYVLSVPAGYDPMSPTPIVFGWHGNTWTGTSFRPTIAVEASSTRPTIFVYPDGLSVEGLPADAAGGVRGTGWDWRQDGRDVALFDALLAELEGRYCVDTTRRYSYGRSHGGFFAHTLACARGDRLRASASVSSGAPAWVLRGMCARPLPVWMAHNADDATIPVSFADQARDRWLGTNGCSTPPSTDGPCSVYACSRAGVQFCLSPTGNHEPPSFAGARIASWFELR